MQFRPALSLLGFAFLWSQSAQGQAAGDANCGVNCAFPGRVVLCNDSITGVGTQSINCGANALLGEAMCASFTAPAGSFLRGVYAVFGPLEPIAQQFDLEVYLENGAAQPGMRIAAMASNSYGLEGDPGRFQAIDVTSLGDIYPLDGDFRICLRKQFEDGPSVCLDTDGSSGDNWVYDVVSRQWYSLGQIPGASDFLIRPEIDVDNFDPWLPGGSCESVDAGVPSDAGVRDVGVVSDATTLPDAFLADAITSIPDAAVVLDAEVVDALVSLDASPQDVGAPMDAAVTDSGPSLAPEITAVSPSKGPSDRSTDLIVTGRNFAEGLVLRIGAIPALDVRVLGSTTINAEVPGQILPGVYDVIVINPDGQTAIATDGFTIEGAATTTTKRDEGCSCRAADRSSGSLFGCLALLVLIRLRRRNG